MLNIHFELNEELKKSYVELLCSKKFGNAKNAKTVKEKFEEYKELFGDYSFEDIIFIEPEKINPLIEELEKKNPNKDDLKKLFKYDGKFQPLIANFFEKNLNLRTCYYCNIDFINVYDEENNKNKFTLDHFIDKGRYPYLALSIFNLIPCCSVCNSKVKGSTPFYEDRELKDTNPYLKSFKFDEKVKFKLFLHKNCKDLNIKSKDDIDIPLKERYSNEYEKYIKVFKLNERYQAHKDIVFEMIKNAELYPKSRLKELQDLTGIPYQQIKQDIFNLIDDEVDLSKEPFSKLKRDMARELGLL
jgi:5-methylcytosine-specific restriction endonuclease McrA